MIDFNAVESLKAAWTGKQVQVTGSAPDLARFKGRAGRVVTVSCNRRALVDFGDGPWHEVRPADLTLAGEPSGADD